MPNLKTENMNKLIHHYTSIENLALILNSKKIRFSRLDMVDDLKEIEGLPKSFSTYTFISCWTDQVEENISLWKMYTQNMRGVRISLPINMFAKKTITPGFYGRQVYKDNVISPFSSSEVLTDTYCIANDFTKDWDFFQKVKYKDDYSDYYSKAYNIKKQGGFTLNPISMIGMFKKKIWEFQNECRFKLHIIPLMKNKNNQIDYSSFRNALQNDMSNDFEYFDVELDVQVLDSLLLRLGPLCDNADTIIVDSLLKQYTQNGKYEISELNGTIRR